MASPNRSQSCTGTRGTAPAATAASISDPATETPQWAACIRSKFASGCRVPTKPYRPEAMMPAPIRMGHVDRCSGPLFSSPVVNYPRREPDGTEGDLPSASAYPSCRGNSKTDTCGRAI